MAMEPDEDMPVEKASEGKSHPYEKVIWWIILAIVLILIILLYSCKVAAA